MKAPLLHRRWNILDSLILVSAMAIGLTLARWWYHHPGFVNPAELNVQSISEIIAWLFLPMTPALIAVRLRKPRPRWRRAIRQPGLQANLVICLATASGLLGSRWGDKPEWSGLLTVIGVGQVDLVGPMLIAGWVLTALSGARRPEPSTIDRLGRAAGWAWIVLWTAKSFLNERCIVRMWLGGY